MDKEQIKKLAQNPKNIPGIYNYCDRWCERCTYTFRCLNYSMSEEEFSDPKTHDLESQAFWGKLNETFKVTLELLEGMAEEQGIDLSSLDLENEKYDPKKDREASQNHECTRAAKVYASMVTKWLDSAEPIFKEKDKELNMNVRLEIPNSDPHGEADELEDAIDVIQWQQHQVYVKISRAFFSRINEDREEADDFPKDSDGSAKVALMCIDRSIAAWGRILEHFPEQEDECLEILVHLERLRRKAEQVFPDARAFVRPGFDE
jgi:hypothetical protein